jgi:hypothetical protein
MRYALGFFGAIVLLCATLVPDDAGYYNQGCYYDSYGQYVCPNQYQSQY